jgi:hypothetical protein
LLVLGTGSQQGKLFERVANGVHVVDRMHERAELVGREHSREAFAEFWGNGLTANSPQIGAKSHW